jgi:small-conductance mechanosensitive channel
MFLLGDKTENRQRQCVHVSARRSWKAIALFITAALIVVPDTLGQWRLAFSQQLQSGGSDTQARSREIVAHLNSVIQFYRATTQPVQKAGEPNDVVYRDQGVALSAQIAGFAFQSAKAEAALMAGDQIGKVASSSSSGAGEQQRMQATEANTEKQIADLQTREAALDKQIASAKPQAVTALQVEKKQIQGSLDLANAMKDALQKIVGMSGAAGSTGLAADIGRLQSSVPELQSNNKIVPPQLITIDSARSSGVTSQGAVLLDLIETRNALDSLLRSNEELHKQALNLHTPLSAVLRNLIQQGQKISQQAETAVQVPIAATGQPAGRSTPVPATTVPAAAAQPSIESITSQFKALSAATVPLSQEIILLEQSHANLVAWQTSANREYASILHWLLLRVFVIAIALALILGAGELWTHFTNKYIRDIRRRRQFLLIRRTVVGFLSVIVLLFGFVTQFNSLATFAGFITAGIAVGLQTILLSVAAYFFIIGRYGVKVGDRITIASVTGDVIDVGLVRFYMMELAGSGTELNPTGRVAVFSNAILFQAGTPLYKQIPGTEYAWHELIVKLTDGANYKLACEAILKEVHAIFEEYRPRIEAQHRGVEDQMQTTIDPPAIESRLQFNTGSFQLWARFPVQIRTASETDEKLTRALLDLMSKTPDVKSAVASTPVIQASVRG